MLTCTYLERVDEYMYLAGFERYTLSASHIENNEQRDELQLKHAQKKKKRKKERCCVALKANVRTCSNSTFHSRRSEDKIYIYIYMIGRIGRRI